MARRFAAAAEAQIDFAIGDLDTLPQGACTCLAYMRINSKHRGGAYKLTQSGSPQIGCNPFDNGDGNLFFAVNGSGSVPYGDTTPPNTNDVLDEFAIFAFSWDGVNGNQIKASVYHAENGPGWVDFGSIGATSNGGAADLLTVGVFASGQWLDADYVMLGFYGTQILHATLAASQIHVSGAAWLTLSSPRAVYAFDQAATTDPVLDLTGGGADETSEANTEVIADLPPGFSFANDVDGEGRLIAAGFGAGAGAKQSSGGGLLLAGGLGFGAGSKRSSGAGLLAAAAIGAGAGTHQGVGSGLLLAGQIGAGAGSHIGLGAGQLVAAHAGRGVGSKLTNGAGVGYAAFAGQSGEPAEPPRPADAVHYGGPQRAVHYRSEQTAVHYN